MTDVGLFELTSHENKLWHLCRIAKTPENDVTIFTSERIFETVSEHLGDAADEYRWLLREDGESIPEFLNRVETIADSELDLLMVNSAPGKRHLRISWSLSRFDPDCITVLWVYNCASWFGDISIRDPKRWLLSRIAKQTVRNFDLVNVQYPPLRDYVEPLLGPDTRLCSIVPVVFDGVPETDDPTTTVTVPGSIDPERRDYDVVLNAFESAADPEDDIQLCLLGSPVGDYGERILDRCRDLEDHGVEVTYFTDWIPVAEYDAWVDRSDVFLAPLVRSIAGPLTEEHYGVTKDSGSVWDALTSATPIVVPNYYAAARFVESSMLHYEDRLDLASTLDRLMSDSAYLASLQENALRNARQFTLEAQRDRFDRLLNNVQSNRKPEGSDPISFL